METGQAAARLLGGHCLRDFRSDLPKSALSIKPVGGFLNPGGADDHPCEAERARFRLRAIEHALCDAQPAIAFIEVHPAKLGVAEAAAFDTERTDNPVRACDNPEGIALC